LNGQAIALRAEQGLGDAIQFVRYATLVHEQRGGRVFVECPPALKDLMKTVRGVEAVHAWNEPSPPAELEIWMMSLPARFDTTLETIPADVPYLRHDPARVARFEAVLGRASSLKIGLNWAGNPEHIRDATRSMPLATLAPLLDVPNVTWISLQKGPAQARDAAAMEQLGLRDAGSLCHDLADTAALMSQLDLVITVDTAPAHLAGALARPVWNLLAWHTDWRWLEKRSDSPWYPTMRLFRQPAPGDWESVVRDVSAAIKIRLSGK
jgi:hypothetical protein